MPYVKCPSCEKVGHTAPTRLSPDLCRHCGDPLPVRRTVVPVSRYQRQLVEERPVPLELQEAA